MAVKPARPDLTEIGVTGTPIWSGQIFPDDNALFNDIPTAMEIYRKMRNDSTLKACFLVKSLPIKATRWWVEPADESPEAADVANQIEENLLRGMTVNWTRILHEICLKFIYGFSIFEKVWEEDGEGRIKLRKLAIRQAETLSRWNFDDSGGPKEMVQMAFSPNKGMETFVIPIEKLVVFVNNQEGSNLLGRSDFRECYREWWTKDRLMRLELIDVERDSIGVPVIGLPEGASKADQAVAKSIVTSIRKDEGGGVVIPQRWQYGSWPAGGTNRVNSSEIIRRYDRQMLVSWLAQFIDLGSGEVGSYALSEDQTNFFLMSLEAEANYIEDCFNRYVIPQMCDYGGYALSKSGKYPRLRHRDIGRFDAKAFADILNSLLQGGWITARGKLDEEFLRKKLFLPEPESYEQPQPSVEANISEEQPEEENPSAMIEKETPKRFGTSKIIKITPDLSDGQENESEYLAGLRAKLIRTFEESSKARKSALENLEDSEWERYENS